MLWEPHAFSYWHETPLGKSRMALQIYLQALWRTWHKTSPQQIQECSGVLSVLLQEKKKEGFKDKDAQTSYDRTSWKTPHTERWDSSEVRNLTPVYPGVPEASFHHQKGSCTGKGNLWRAESQWPHRQHRPSLCTSNSKRKGNKICWIRCKG